MSDKPPSSGALRAAGFLVAAALSGSESFWTFASGAQARIEFAWILAGACVVGIASMASGIAAAAVGLRPSLVRAAVLLVPITVTALRTSLRGSLSLDAALGPGLRWASYLGLILVCMLLASRATEESAFLRGLCGLVHGTVAILAIRTIDIDRMISALRAEPIQPIIAVVLGIAMLLPVVRGASAARGLEPTVIRNGVAPLACGIASALLLGPGGPYLPAPPRTQDGMPVVLIVLDTVRADAVELYSRQVRTPGLQAFAQEATLYRNAYSNGTNSLAGHGALFSGLLPSDHKGHPKKATATLALHEPLDPSVPLAAERLSQRGYVTAGISANYGYFSPHFGLTRGMRWIRADGVMANFVPFSWPLRSRLLGQASLPAVRPWEASRVRQASERWLGRAGGAFFLFVNFMDAHSVHDDPARHETVYRNRKGFDSGDAGMSEQRRNYQSSVAYLDSEFERLLRFMKSQPWWDSALVIVTADHGELFGEHGQFSHGNVFPYEGVIRVPLIIKQPRQNEPRVESGLVSLRDVPALIEDAAAGKTWRPSGDLRPVILTEGWWSGPNPISLPPAGAPFSRAIRLGSHKLIEQWDGRHLLFDLDRDPLENDNLFLTDPKLAEGIKTVMLRSLPALDAKAGPSRNHGELPAETLERLRSLGYVR